MVMGRMTGPAGDVLFTNPEQSNLDRVMRFLAPPTAGMAKDVSDLGRGLYHDFISRHANGQPELPKMLAKDAWSYTPGLNLWWSRGVFDIGLRHRLMETID